MAQCACARHGARLARMPSVLQIFAITFPFFALVAAGYFAARRRLVPIEAIPGLNIFVLYFALPCMLYRFGARTPVSELFDVPVLMVWGFGAVTMVGGVIAVTRRARIGWNDGAFGALVATFSNTGFMGVPLLAALLGAGVAGPVMLTITFDVVVTSSLCIALSRLDGANASAGAALRQASRGVLLNPLLWSIVLGALTSALRFELPGPIDRTLAMMAEAATPAALFTIGAVLARPALIAARTGMARMRAPVGDVLPVVVAKLLVHPLYIYVLARGAMALGLPIGRDALVAIVLVAALPSASNVSMLAERYGADNGRIARIILWTTVAAFFTFPLATRWLR